MASAITVGVRVRPFNAREMKFQSKCIVNMDPQTTFLSIVRQGKVLDEKPREFTFDHAFWTHSKDDEEQPGRPFADQVTVYNALGKPIVENATKGYNACLFAYGQTGSGKTYSMMGTQSDPGVLPRIGTELFEKVSALTDAGLSVQVSCSFAEIYNDVVQDLMSESQVKDGLPIRKHPKLGIFVQGLKAIAAKTPEEFNALLDRALSSRAVSSTKMNNTSSRSHAVILVSVVQTDTSSGTTKTGKMSLVDLAGSERAESTGATGATMVEAQNINYSLSVLGMCLSRLADIAEGKTKDGAHVPFRDSSLTYLLSDNLGGNSKTSMIAAISPADVNFEETLSTLRFASVTKKVKTKAVVNESANAKLIRELREELQSLKSRLQAMPEDGAPPSAPATTDDRDATGSAAADSQDDDGDEKETRHVDPMADVSGDKDTAAAPGEPLPTTVETMEGGEEEVKEEEEAAEGLLSAEATYAALEQLEGEALDATSVLRQSSERADSTTTPPRKPGPGLGLKLNLGALGGGGDRSSAPADGSQEFDDMRSPEPTPPPGSAAAAEQEEDHIEVQSHIDWRRPLFVRLSQAGPNDPAAIQINEGDTQLAFAPDAIGTVNFNGLTRETTLRGEAGTFHNGMLVDEQVHLRHNDRVIIGRHVFRFSHGEGVGNACDFERNPTDDEHCILLEKYERATLIEARAKDAMAILKAYLGPILQQRSNPAAAQGGGSIDTSGIATPRGSHPVVGAILDDLSFYNAASFRLEAQLAEEYPASLDADAAFGIPKDTTTELDAALDEQRKQQDEKEQMLRQLKEELQRAQSRPRAQSVVAAPPPKYQPPPTPPAAPAATAECPPPTGDDKAKKVDEQPAPKPKSEEKKDDAPAPSTPPKSPATVPASSFGAANDSVGSPGGVEQWTTEAWVEDDEKEAEHQEELDVHCVEAVLADEMAWHKVVRTQRQFRTAPADTADLAIWNNLGANPPFMSDSMLAIERTATLLVCDPQVKRDEFAQRCVALSARFLFIFKKLDGRERIVTAIYLPGASTATRPVNKGQVILDVTPACRRSPDDNSYNGTQAMLSLQLKSQAEAVNWSQWIERHAVPEQPMTMMKRSLLQLVTDTPGDLASGAVLGEVGEPFDLRNAWKHDSTVDSCLQCKQKFRFFRRRHHCRDCGGIFCSDCLNKNKRCEHCSNTTTTQKGNLGSEANQKPLQRNVCIVPSSTLANGHLLQEYFQVRLRSWPSVNAYRAVPHSALSKDIEPVALLADSYRARIDKWPSSHIAHFRRCPQNPNVLMLWTTNAQTAAHHGRAASITSAHSKLDFHTMAFLNAASRERALEALSLLVGRRAYLSPSAGITILDESDFLVEHRGEDATSGGGEAPAAASDDAPCCLVRVTSHVSMDLKVWVGNDTGRVVLQQGGFGVLAMLGRVDYTPWDSQALATSRLEVLAKVPMGHDGSRDCLYLLISEQWLAQVDEMAVSKGADIAAVALHFQESSVLFVVSTHASSIEDDFVDIDEEGEDEDLKGSFRVRRAIDGLADLAPTLNPKMDLIEQFDSVFIVGHSGLNEFTSTPAPVQYRSPTFQLARASPTHIEGVAAVACPVLSKLSHLPSSARRVLNVDSVTVTWLAPFYEKAEHDPRVALDQDVALEAVDLSATCPHFDISTRRPTEIMLAHLMPEYYLQRSLLVNVADLGTARIPLALYQAAPGETVDTDADLHRYGERTAQIRVVVTVRA